MFALIACGAKKKIGVKKTAPKGGSEKIKQKCLNFIGCKRVWAILKHRFFLDGFSLLSYFTHGFE